MTTIIATSQADSGVWATTTDTTIVTALAPGAPTLLASPDGNVTTTQAITLIWAPHPGSPHRLQPGTGRRQVITTTRYLAYHPAFRHPHLDGTSLQRVWLLGWPSPGRWRKPPSTTSICRWCCETISDENVAAISQIGANGIRVNRLIFEAGGTDATGLN